MKKSYYFLILVLFVLSCSTTQVQKTKLTNKKKLKVLKTNLNLTKSEYKSLKNKNIIISEVYKTFNDSIDISNINRRLDSFFLKNYSKEQLIASLELERIYKGSFMSFEFNPNLDSTKLLNFNNEKEFGKFVKSIDNTFKKGIENVTIIKDSTIIKKDSLN